MALTTLDALGEPVYRRLWLAGLAANAGRWMDLLVLGWVTLDLTGSPFMVGVVAFCRSVPMIVLGLLAGVVADRVPQSRVLVLTQATNLAAAALLALLFGGGRAGLGVLIALEATLGVAWAVEFPARRTLLSTLVGPGRLTNAMSLENVSMQASKMVGPALAGLLLGRAGPAACYAALALLYAAALGLTLALHRRLPATAAKPTQPVLASLAAGLREARAHPAIRGVLAVTVLMNALVFPYQHMLAVFARDVLLVGPERLGLLAAASGLGALAGSLAVASRRGFSHHTQLFAAGSGLGALLVCAFALSPWYALSLGIQFLSGIAESAFGTMQSTIVLLASPESARGRTMGVLSACIGTQPLGTLWIGFFSAQIGARAATAAGAAAALLLMLPLASRLFLRAGDLPDPAHRTRPP